MDRRSNYPYTRRSKPPPNYAEDDDISDYDDVVLGGPQFDDDDDAITSDDYSNHHRHHHRHRHPNKHRKLSNYNYQFTPRPTPGDWSEQATFILLDTWGDRYLQLGRSSLRVEDWNEVAERVSDATRVKLGVSDCRNRLNALKTRYKKEKTRAEENGSTKWVYFKKMDALMTMSPRQLQQQEQCGLACGVDSGEFVFMNPRVYLEHSNALDEMRDSPEGSEDEEDDDDEDDDEVDDESYRMLSDSIKRVGEIYERIEDSKRQHMVELERMRGEFQRELEVQKKEMIDRTKAEVAKLSRCDDEDSVYSAEIENVVV